jgi:hypothetical protein
MRGRRGRYLGIWVGMGARRVLQRRVFDYFVFIDF